MLLLSTYWLRCRAWWSLQRWLFRGWLAMVLIRWARRLQRLAVWVFPELAEDGE